MVVSCETLVPGLNDSVGSLFLVKQWLNGMFHGKSVEQWLMKFGRVFMEFKKCLKIDRFWAKTQ